MISNVENLLKSIKYLEQELVLLSQDSNYVVTPEGKYKLMQCITTITLEVSMLVYDKDNLIHPWPNESTLPIEPSTSHEIKHEEYIEVAPISSELNVQSAQLKPINNTLQNVASKQSRLDSINDKMGQTADKNLGDKLTGKPISHLQQGVPLNDKMLIIKHLFNGNAIQYENAMKQLDAFNNIDDALLYVKDVLSSTYHWDSKDEVYQSLLNLVLRRYLV